MAQHTPHRRRLRTTALLGLLAFALTLVACTKGVPTPEFIDQYEFNNFKTAAASAPEEGWTPYWLGREFTIRGAVYRGPGLGDLPGERFDKGGIQVSYSPDPLTGHGGGLRLFLYSRAAWDEDRSRQYAPATRYVTVAGQEAKLSVLTGDTRPIDQLRLLVTFGDTTVLVIAGSGGAKTPGGPDANPLIDEQTFLTVLQNLRPYPE